MKWFVLLLGLLVSGLAGAETATGLTIQTQPPGLEIRIQRPEGLKHLGYAGTPLSFSAPRQVAIAAWYADVELARKVLPMSAAATPNSVWPEEPWVVPLPAPLWWRYHLWHQRFWLVLALVLGVLGDRLLLAPRRRKGRDLIRRERRLEELGVKADSQDPLVGTQMGPYLLVSRLGAGGMATVYRAVPHATLDGSRSAAVKVIQGEGHFHAEYRARFQREIVVTTKLDHHHIVKVLDFGDQDGVIYLAMELIEGSSLRAKVRAGGSSVREVLEWMDPILQAVHYAHRHEVVHRDLKPDNVMLETGGRVVVMDFGLARREDLAVVTQVGSALGTPAYMAPEQFQGGETDARSDQYALGIMLHELLAGDIPFANVTDPIQLVMKHLSEPPIPLRQVRPDVSPALEAVVLRMLAKDVHGRFPHLEAVREALRVV